MRVPTAIDAGGWKHRFVTPTCATIVALVVHLGILFAFAYESSTAVTIGDLPAAIAVEIVLSPFEQPTETLQARIPVDLPDRSAVARTTVEPAMPVVRPTNALKRPAARVVEHQVSSKRRSPPLTVVRTAGQAGASGSSASGFTDIVAPSVGPSTVPLLAMIERASPFPRATPELHEPVMQLAVPVRFRS